ncbi:transcription intermediary factor 1-beta-like [Mytilus edulis]|uniref:transcription intermediary factor 1-beta-like n=1 Tax=Mytilus edulis TaxID=6550 RepID=UPI0039EECB1C
MTTDEIASFCNICLTRDQNKLAEEYCPQCEEALCGDCRHHHKISKSTKSHQTISLEKYNKLPSFIKQIKHNCQEHDCFLECYCKCHDSLCCKRCLISSHKECKETIFIEDFLTPSSRYHSVALHNIEKALKDLEINICSALKDRNRNLIELREQKQKISEQIKEKRQEINTRLDNLEDALLEKASAMENEYCLKINKVIAKLEDEKKK